MKRRIASDEQSGFGLAPVAPPPPAPKRRAAPKPAPSPAAPATATPTTPWERVAAECPAGRASADHELPAERAVCACGWSGALATIGEHQCRSVALVERWSWVHIRRAAGGPVRCVPARPIGVRRWDLLEFRGGSLRRSTFETWRRLVYEPAEGLAYADIVTPAYQAAEGAGRRSVVVGE